MTERYFDANGNCVKTVSYNDEGEIESESIRDADGNLICKIEYSSSQLNCSYEYAYDTSGRTISRIHYDKDKEIAEKIDYEYDSKEKAMTGRIRDKNGNSIGQSKLTYNSNGDLLSEEFYYDSGAVEKSMYNEKSQLIRNESGIGTNDMLCSEYEFDKGGEWVQMEMTVREDDEMCIYRMELEYEEMIITLE